MPRPKHIGPYKRYLQDPDAALPRTTAWIKQKRGKLLTSRQASEIDHHRHEDTDGYLTDASSSSSRSLLIPSTTGIKVVFSGEEDSGSDLSSCGYSTVNAELNTSSISLSDEDLDIISVEQGSEASISEAGSLMAAEVRRLKNELALYKGMASIAEDFPKLVPKIKELLSLFSESSNSISNSKVRGVIVANCNETNHSQVIRFGSKLVPKRAISKLQHEKETLLAAELCTLVFSPQEMALCSMKGKKSNKHKKSFQKHRIDESKIKGIIDYILQRKGLSGDQAEKRIRKAIGNKLANFCRTDEGRRILMQNKLESASHQLSDEMPSTLCRCRDSTRVQELN